MSEILQKGFDDAQGCTAVKNPREARLRWEAFGKVGNCRGTQKKKKKNHLVESEPGWSTGHSLFGATSVTLAFSAFS